MKNEMVYAVAAACWLATIIVSQVSFGQEGPVAGGDNRVAEYSQQGVRHGWIPEARGWETGPKSKPGPVGIQSLFANGDWTRGLQETVEEGKAGRKEKPVDFTPKFITNDGNEFKNYAVVVGASWCTFCKDMLPAVDKLRGEGYLVYYLEVDTKEHKGLERPDAYKATNYPTVLVYDDGKETRRVTGTQSEKWLRSLLKPYPKPSPKPEPLPPVPTPLPSPPSPRPEPSIYDEL